MANVFLGRLPTLRSAQETESQIPPALAGAFCGRQGVFLEITGKLCSPHVAPRQAEPMPDPPHGHGGPGAFLEQLSEMSPEPGT